MPLKKLTLKPGVNRENTRYTTEGGWYEGDKVRFRQGTPEKIGGWVRTSEATYLGVCRSLGAWVANDGFKLLGVGTNVKFYVETSGTYYDITPVVSTDALPAGSAATVSGSNTVTITYGATTPTADSYVTFLGMGSVNGIDMDAEFQITSVDTGLGVFTVQAANAASATGAGGASCSAAYQLSVAPEASEAIAGWGSGGWGEGAWGLSESTITTPLPLWSQAPFGQDLVFARTGSEIFYWAYSSGFGTRAVPLSADPAAAATPTQVGFVTVSDISRFVFAFGCTEYGTGVYNPLLVRWSDQENAYDWAPSATTQSGELPLSRGSTIVAAQQARQEILVWTDTSLYALQYVGAPVVWSAQLIGDNISIAGRNSVAYANGVAYWMGVDKFYRYDGTTTTLRCDLRQFIFNNINIEQRSQIFAGTNEGFNEVWWFYCSTGATAIDRYVVYNYAEDVWYYGTMGRTAWLDSGLFTGPVAATYINNLVEHEQGTDDTATGVAQPISAYIASSEFDLDDGHNFMFVWRVLPDVTFRGSLSDPPAVTMYLYPLQNSGSGYSNPASVGGTNEAVISRGVALPIETFTGQVFTRVRGRQMVMKVESTGLGVAWQLGSPRLDMRKDGRR